MSTASKDPNDLVAGGSQPLDDLTQIPGIGPKRQQWLRDVFGVETYEDLAGLTVDAIESQIKAEGRIASRTEIEGWIEAAAALAVEGAARHTGSPGAMPSNSPPVREGDWAAVAAFVVEFQVQVGAGGMAGLRTTVHHMEADRSMVWEGIEHDQLCAWMVSQVASTRPEYVTPDAARAAALAIPEEPVAPAEPEPVSAPPAVRPSGLPPTPLTLSVVRVDAYQPVGTSVLVGQGEHRKMFSGFLQGDQPFDLEASLDLGGPQAAAFTRQKAVLWTQFQAYDLTKQEAIQLGDSDPVQVREDQFRYTIRLAGTSLPPGLYRLRTVAKCHDSQTQFGFMEVPLIQVV